jgi:putative glutamine amidotransferase
MTPRIAIPTPTSFDLTYNRANLPAYVDAVKRAGGEPVEVPLTLDDAEVRRVVSTCDGILLPGSPADVEPALYGQERMEATAPADIAREQVDRALLEEAYASGQPVLAICFGAQMLNVWRGGTLVQDLAVMPVNHSAGKAVAVAHAAAVVPGSVLGETIDSSEVTGGDDALRLPMNSSHHQSVGIPGDGLRVTARCPQDGVVEAIEAPFDGSQRHFVLGVQWHPERSIDSSPTSRALFARLIEEASLWRR